jgi:lipopolysaccharide exporter
MTNGTSKRTSVAAGAAIAVGMRWADRIIGVMSTLILARLLVPSDFGIVAAASLLIALVDVFFDMGVHIVLIQNRNASEDDFNTAWTLRVIQSIVVGCTVVALAGWAAGYFRNPLLVDVIQVMAVSIVIGGFENIAVVRFQKDMEFGRDFQFVFSKRIIGFAVTIIAAFQLQSYWALVLGTLAGRTAGVAISYLMCPTRPRFSLKKIRLLWSYSQWLLVNSVGSFSDQRMDKIYVGRVTGSAELGSYTLADEIAAMPSTELLAPIGRVLFPAFVAARESPAQFARAFLLALAVQAMIVIPAGAGLSLLAPEVVYFMLGEKWVSTIPLIRTLALMNIAFALASSSGYLLLAIGRYKENAGIVWMRVLLFGAAILVFLPGDSVQAVAQLRLAVAFASLGVLMALVLHYIRQLRYRDLVAQVWRPIIGTSVMAVVLLSVPVLPSFPLAVQLIGKIGLGAVTYGLTIIACWRYFGCPYGGESYVLEKMGILPQIKSILRL